MTTGRQARDTSFFLPPANAAGWRSFTPPSKTEGSSARPSTGRVEQGESVDGPRTWFSGGAGLLSTIIFLSAITLSSSFMF